MKLSVRNTLINWFCWRYLYTKFHDSRIILSKVIWEWWNPPPPSRNIWCQKKI